MKGANEGLRKDSITSMKSFITAGNREPSGVNQMAQGDSRLSKGLLTMTSGMILVGLRRRLADKGRKKLASMGKMCIWFWI